MTLSPLLACDPGVRASGLAVFSDGKLSAVYYTADPGVLAWLPAETRCICELPQIYSYGKAKGDPNDLVDLTWAAGRILRAFTTIQVVRPGQWKGRLPKDVHHARVRSLLSPAEAAVLAHSKVPAGKLHNVLDAVALGLWKLGRR